MPFMLLRCAWSHVFAEQARFTATTVRSEAQASIIKMRDSMAKHKSKFVTFEEGQEIGIQFGDEVDDDGSVYVFIQDFLKRPDGEWYQAELSGKLLVGDIIAKVGPLSVEGAKFLARALLHGNFCHSVILLPVDTMFVCTRAFGIPVCK